MVNRLTRLFSPNTPSHPHTQPAAHLGPKPPRTCPAGRESCPPRAPASCPALTARFRDRLPARRAPGALPQPHKGKPKPHRPGPWPPECDSPRGAGLESLCRPRGAEWATDRAALPPESWAAASNPSQPPLCRATPYPGPRLCVCAHRTPAPENTEHPLQRHAGLTRQPSRGPTINPRRRSGPPSRSSCPSLPIPQMRRLGLRAGLLPKLQAAGDRADPKASVLPARKAVLPLPADLVRLLKGWLSPRPSSYAAQGPTTIRTAAQRSHPGFKP